MFNITSTPPDSAWLAAKRNELELAVKQKQRLQRGINILSYFAIVVSLIVLFAVGSRIERVNGIFWFAAILWLVFTIVFEGVQRAPSIAVFLTLVASVFAAQDELRTVLGLVIIGFVILGSAVISVRTNSWVNSLCFLTVDLDKSLGDLEEIESADAPPILGAVQSDSVVARYHDAVLKHGRQLTRGEGKAILAWVDGASERARKAQQEEALKALTVGVA